MSAFMTDDDLAAFERTPPHDLAAEQCTVGGMMMSKDAIADVIEIIGPADHWRPAHQLIHEVILDLYARGEPADAVTVANELTKRGLITKMGGPPYLHTCLEVTPHAGSAGYYARIVREKSLLRKLTEVGPRIAQMGYSGTGGDADDLVDQAEAAMYAITDRRSADDLLSMAEIWPEALGSIRETDRDPRALTGVPTGFADLDALTHGFQPGQFIVFAARPALGKSTVVLDTARCAAVKHGLTTAFFSLEMSRLEITQRMISAEERVPLHSIRTGQMTEGDWEKVGKCEDRITRAPLFIDDSPGTTIMQIRAKCRRLKQRRDLRLVIIDYIQLMSSPKRVENRQQEVSEISRGLKLLAKELQIPVIGVAQLNRGPEQRADKRPFLADLRESGSLEQDSDVVILLFREDAYDRESPKAGEAEFIVAKHRNGPTVTVSVAAQLHYSRFCDMARI
jgi:replicative DNA helicase